ncbi:MAG: type II toxin-antitoxin system RelE/ParE family toxin [Candidatus Omnitrophota bacterium]
MRKKAIYYEDERNSRPVEEFINDLESKTKAKVLARIEFLEERWQELRRPYVDTLEEGLYELRVILSGNQVRVIYTYMFKDYIVLLHGIIKKTKEIPRDDMLKAKNRMNDFQMRYKEGKIKLPRWFL